MLQKKKRKYILIAKVEPQKFVKYRFNDLNKVIPFMMKKYPGVYWINFYYNTGDHAGKIYYTWGKNKGLEAAK